MQTKFIIKVIIQFHIAMLYFLVLIVMERIPRVYKFHGATDSKAD
jgi:uncharacterized protein YqhQ